MSLIKNKRRYETKEESLKVLQKLELKYNPEKKGHKKSRKSDKKKSLEEAA